MKLLFTRSENEVLISHSLYKHTYCSRYILKGYILPEENKIPSIIICREKEIKK